MKVYADMSDRELKKWIKDNPVQNKKSNMDRLLSKPTEELEDMLLELKQKHNPDTNSIYLHDPMTRKKINDVELAIYRQKIQGSKW